MHMELRSAHTKKKQQQTKHIAFIQQGSDKEMPQKIE